MELFTLVTGLIYIVLEIRQKNFMWIVGILTSAAAMWVFFRQGLYASFGLNAYYLVTSFIGLWQWRSAKAAMESSAGAGPAGAIHLNRLSLRTVLLSVLAVIAGTLVLFMLMEMLENPMSFLDAAVAVLSAVATWWLVRSYLEQWWLWIAADMMSTALCISQGLGWMAVLYGFYALSAVYGLYHWKRHGVYL